MSKFRDLISGNAPVLIHFYIDNNTIGERMHEVVKEVANHFEDKARIVEINAESNRDVARALQVASLPDFMIYKDGEMLWRTQGGQSAEALIKVLDSYTTA